MHLTPATMTPPRPLAARRRALAEPSRPTLVAILPGWPGAFDRQADRRPEPLVVPQGGRRRDVRHVAAHLGAAAFRGEGPAPDAYAGKCPLWKRSTLEAWIARGGSL